MVLENEVEYGALRRILDLSRGTSSFTFAVCNSPALRQSLCQRLRAEGIPFHEAHLGLGTTDPVAAALAALPPEHSGPVFIIGLDYLLAESTPGSDHLLAVMGRSRERWRTSFPARPLVFWLTHHTAVRVLTHAPDFRAWVSHELEFADESPASALRPDHGSYTSNYLWLTNLDAPAKRARLAELDQRLTLTAPEPALFQEWARSWEEKLTLLRALGETHDAERHATALLEHYPPGDEATLPWRLNTLDHLALLLTSRGQLDEALRIRREEELPVYEKLGDVRSRAVTMGKIADILSARGQLDEALRIRREEELPVYEKLGDVRSRAVTMGQIADILRARGQLDEALRIRREEQLPVYEKLGDVRSRAVTLGKIADILSARGQLDEALRIRREELLPVFENLGDVRSRAVAMGQIADILSARGQLDEALRIRREDQLPVYEKLGDVREMIVGRTMVAQMLAMRGQEEDVMEMVTHLAWSWREAKRMGLPEALQIEALAGEMGMPAEMLAQVAEKV